MPRPMTPEDLWRFGRVGAPALAPKGRLVVPVTTYDMDENKGRTRLWLVDGEGDPVSLTSASADSKAPAVSPDGARLAFTRQGPAEGAKPQLHIMPLDGGEPEEVTDLPLGVLGAKWLPDSSGLVVLAYLLKGYLSVEETRTEAKRREEDTVTAHVTEDAIYRFWDTWLSTGEVPHLFHLDPTTRDLRDLTPTSDRWWVWPAAADPVSKFDISPDGREVAFSADRGQPPHRLVLWSVFTVDLQSGEERHLTSDATGHCTRPRYSPDGSTIVYGMQREPDFYGDRALLVAFDRQSEEHRVLTEEWDRSAAGWEFDSRGDLVLVAEEDGRQHLFRMPLGGGTPVLLAEGGTLDSPLPDPDGAVFVLHQSLSAPPEVARLGGDGGLEAVTDFNGGLLSELGLGDVEDVRFPGWEGVEIQMFVVYPPGFDPARRWPLVHMIHGGPHGTFGDAFHFRWNAHAFASPGYVVALVNFHGSTSFGQAFAASIHGEWGDKPTADMLAATDHLVEQGLIDQERMAITGGSYGGYLTAWLTTQTDRFACAVAHAAVTDLPGMYASDITFGRARSYGAEIWEDRELVERWSPSAHAAGYSTPTLVIHGERDYRVPLTQGLELYGVLKAKGVEARLVYYPDENHWVLSPQNSLHWYGEVLGWLGRHLA